MITDSVMKSIYEKVKTPVKLGAVMKTDGRLCDSPVVFRYDGRYYMSFISIDDKTVNGYETHLAVSDDLLHWSEVGIIMGKPGSWDSSQTGGYAQFIDNTFGGSNEISRVNGKFVFAYIGGSFKGYETDPLSIGLAECEDFTDNSSYVRRTHPVLSGSDCDARRGETLTLYKPHMFTDMMNTTGHRYVCAYNAKDESNRESIFLAVSDNATEWKRYGDRAVISVFDCNASVHINGDPQIVIIDGYYIMFYFIFEGNKTRNTFAVSENLADWTKWNGEPLIQSEYEWENVYAHKQWIISEKGRVYHYYCAVNDKRERFIALAVSD